MCIWSLCQIILRGSGHGFQALNSAFIQQDIFDYCSMPGNEIVGANSLDFAIQLFSIHIKNGHWTLLSQFHYPEYKFTRILKTFDMSTHLLFTSARNVSFK